MGKVPVFMEFTSLVIEGKSKFITHRIINNVRSQRQGRERIGVHTHLKGLAFMGGG